MKPQIKLFREIQAVIRKYLPKQTQDYYKSYCKENFYTFSDEADPQRVRDLMVRAEEHVRWVLKKYKIDESAAAGVHDLVARL